jgi:hypothetical protein
MKRPRLGVRVTLLRSEQSKSMKTSPGIGVIEATRTEWGIGKGQWKRDVRNLPQTLHLRGQIRVFYFGIGSRYKLKYTGRSSVIEQLYAII